MPKSHLDVPPVVETRSGRHVNIKNPKHGDIVISDIAFNLSRMPRFNGATMGAIPYSVAQHAVWAAVISEIELGADCVTALQVLVAPSYKAYTFDVGEPVKRLSELYAPVTTIEAGLQGHIYHALQLATPTERVKKVVGKSYLAAHSVEAHYLMPSGGRPWTSPPPHQCLLDKFLPPIEAPHAFQLIMLAYSQLIEGRALQGTWMGIVKSVISGARPHLNS